MARALKSPGRPTAPRRQRLLILLLVAAPMVAVAGLAAVLSRTLRVAPIAFGAGTWLAAVAAAAAVATTFPPSPLEARRWRGRPIVSTVLRAAAVVVPVIAAIAVSIGASRVLPRAASWPEAALRLIIILGLSTATLVLVERAARRMLPLAALLQLSLVFPDQAPSRFSVARGASTRDLQARVTEATEAGSENDAYRLAIAILMLIAGLSDHDRRTRGHSERTRILSELIADQLKLPAADRDRLRWASLLHDVGKLAVPPDVLNKRSAPTESEWELLRNHPIIGARLVAPLIPWLGEWARAVEQHHERWDGAGYPFGIAGEDIAYGARIVAVADAYEVMTGARPYKRPLSAAAARAELARGAGSHFDPAIVRAFLNISIGRLRWVVGPMTWLAQLPLVGALPAWGTSVASGGAAAVSLVAVAATGVVQVPPEPPPPSVASVEGTDTVARPRPRPSSSATPTETDTTAATVAPPVEESPITSSPSPDTPTVRPSLVLPTIAPASPQPPSASPSPSPSATTPSASPSPSLSPSPSPGTSPSPTTSATPTASPSPSPSPSESASTSPSPSESVSPSTSPSPSPSPSESVSPSPSPSPSPSDEPSPSPTEPSPSPTEPDPTDTATGPATEAPAEAPTEAAPVAWALGLPVLAAAAVAARRPRRPRG